MNPVKELQNHGQAVWLDFLARGFIAKGDLKQLVESDGVRGVTSNPSIFEKAIGSSDEYDSALAQLLKNGDRSVAVSTSSSRSRNPACRRRTAAGLRSTPWCGRLR